MKNKKALSKVISFLLVLAIIFVSIPLSASAEEAKIRFGVLSDIHYFADSLKSDCEEYDEWLYNKHKEYDDTDALLDNALDGILRNAVEDGSTYVLIPGDMTKDGEKKSHEALAARLAEFEEETGIQVFVVPGNHDINNSKSITFENGFAEPA